MDLIVRKKIEPIILMTPLAITKTNFLVKLAKKEVGWLGEVEELEPFQYLITDIHLFKQEVTGTETDIDGTALAEFFSENIDICDRIRFWGHSHVNMGVSPSGTDTDTIKELQGNGAPFFIMGIFNKKQETHFEIYTNDFIMKKVGWKPYFDTQFDMTILKAEYDEKVTEASNVYQVPVYNRNQSWGRLTGEYFGSQRVYEYQGRKGYWSAGAFIPVPANAKLTGTYEPFKGQQTFGNFFESDDPKDTQYERNFDSGGSKDDDTANNGNPDSGHSKTSGNIRSLKAGKQADGGRSRVWSNREQSDNKSGKARA